MDALTPWARVKSVEALAEWWTSQRPNTGGAGAELQQIPWQAVHVELLRPGAREQLLLRVPRMAWLRRAPRAHFVLFVEQERPGAGSELVVWGLAPVVAEPERLFPSAARRDRHLLMQRHHVLRRPYVEFAHRLNGMPAPPPPGRQRLFYPLLSNFSQLATLYRHEWAVEPHAMRVHPQAEGSRDGVWMRRCQAVMQALVQLLLQHDPTSARQDVSAAADIGTHAASAMTAVRTHYLCTPDTDLLTPVDRLAEWKARLALLVWYLQLPGEEVRRLVLRAQRLLLYSMIQLYWTSEPAIASLCAHAVLPFHCRLLGAQSVGSADHPWWHTGDCTLIDWAAERSRLVQHAQSLPVTDIAPPSFPPPSSFSSFSSSSSSSSLSSLLANGKRRCAGAQAQCSIDVDAAYLAAVERKLVGTPVCSGTVFSRTTSWPRALSAWLLQARTHVIMFASGTYHVLPTEQAAELYVRDTSAVRGQVQIGAGMPTALVLLLRARPGDSAAATAVLQQPIRVAEAIRDQVQLLAGSSGSGTDLPRHLPRPQLFPCELSNVSAVPTTPTAWLVYFPNVYTADPLATSQIIIGPSLQGVLPLPSSLPSSSSSSSSLPSSSPELSLLISAHCVEGTVWPLDPAVARLHPPPTAATVTSVQQRFDISHYLGAPSALPRQTTQPRYLGSRVLSSFSSSFSSSSFSRSSSSSSSSSLISLSPTRVYCEPWTSMASAEEGTMWSYRPERVELAQMERLREFHSGETQQCRACSLPRRAFLVDSAPLEAHDPGLTRPDLLPHHALLLYTDMARWIVALHGAHCALLASGNAPPVLADRQLLLRLSAYAKVVFRGVFGHIQAALLPLSSPSFASSSSLLNRTPAEQRNCPLDQMMLDGFAQPCLETLFGLTARQVRGGQELAFGEQSSRKLHVSGPRRGQWYDFRSRRGGIGLIAFVANELYPTEGQQTAWLHAYERVLGWLSTISDADLHAALATLGTSADEAEARDVPALSAVEIERLKTSGGACAVLPGSTGYDYLASTRGLGALPDWLLDQWKTTAPLLSLETTQYFVKRGAPLRPCSSLMAWMRGADDTLPLKLQQIYLQRNRQRSNRPEKLVVEDGGHTLPSKKIRLLQVPSDARVPGAGEGGEGGGGEGGGARARVVVHDNAFVPLHTHADDDALHASERPILLAEGVETGLSLVLAFPGAHVYAACGVTRWRHFDRCSLLTTRRVILCRDNATAGSASHTATDLAANTARAALVQRGYVVQQVWPTPRYGDFNDVHQAYPGAPGTERVREMVCAAMPDLQAWTSPPSPHTSKENISMPIDNERAEAARGGGGEEEERVGREEEGEDDDDDDALARALDRVVSDQEWTQAALQAEQQTLARQAAKRPHAETQA